MPAKAAHEAAHAKAARQKKVLLLLVVPLGAALFYAYRTVSKLNQSPSAAPPAAATTSAPAASGTPASPGPVTPAPATVQAASPATKLTSFAQLPSRDPFSTSRRSSTVVSVNLPAGRKEQQKKPSPPPTSAVIALDRTLLRVRLHANFGHASGAARRPLFRVVAVTQKTAKVVVVGKGRRHAYTLQVDAPRILSGSDRHLYALMLLPQGTPVPAAVPHTQTAQTTTTAGSHGG